MKNALLPAVVLVLGLVAIWRVEVLARVRLNAGRATRAEVEMSLRERAAAVALAEGTQAADIARRNAEQELAALQARQAATLESELQADRLEAERRAIEAYAQAQVDLAPELVRSERDRPTRESVAAITSAYNTYSETMERRMATPVGLEKFVELMRR